jgi:hypothetical protein
MRLGTGHARGLAATRSLTSQINQGAQRHSVSRAFRGTPDALTGHFLSNDPLLNHIWYAGAYTLNLVREVPGTRDLPGCGQ